MILRPQHNFTVVRQIANHTDTATYYVRAVIRNSYTDEIIDTLNLTDKGGQRFSKNWRIPADPSGEGFDISIVTSVYTDPGYTTKSENYGDEENSHLIENKGIGARGSSGVGQSDLRRIIKEELSNMLESEKERIEKEPEKPVEKPEKEPMRWDDVLSAISRLESVLKPERPEKVELNPVFDGISSILKAIDEKEVTPVTDLSPILEKMTENESSDGLTREEMVGLLNNLAQAIENGLPEKIAEILATTTFQIAATTAKMKLPVAPKEKEEEEINIDQLTS